MELKPAEKVSAGFVMFLWTKPGKKLEPEQLLLLGFEFRVSDDTFIP